MNHDFDLKEFEGISRLFPLREVVLFPHVVIPLHIFEPRYRQMTEDALASDQLITMVQGLGIEGLASGVPQIASVGCVGRILRHERLSDGRFNLLLLGKARVRIKHELNVQTLYRQAEVEILQEVGDQIADPESRERLIWYFERLHRTRLEPELSTILRDEMTLGTLCDILSYSSCLTAELKQALLDVSHVPTRCEEFQRIMARELDGRPVQSEQFRSFPPPFSLN